MSKIATLEINSKFRKEGDSINNFQFTLPQQISNVKAIMPQSATMYHNEYTINSYNNTFNFIHSDATPYSLTLPTAFYDGETLATSLQTAMNAAISLTSYTVSYDTTYFKYLISIDSGTFSISIPSSKSMLYVLGFTQTFSYTGLGTYTSDITANLSTKTYHFASNDLISNYTYSAKGVKNIITTIDQIYEDGTLILAKEELAKKLTPANETIQTFNIQVLNEDWNLAKINGDFILRLNLIVD